MKENLLETDLTFSEVQKLREYIKPYLNHIDELKLYESKLIIYMKNGFYLSLDYNTGVIDLDTYPYDG